jgi:protein phosphatase
MLTIPAEGQLVCVGDTHGQLEDVFTIMHLNGLPSPTNRYLFNGDFVDRGEFGVEIMLTLLGFLVWNPECIALNRGNHEASSMNQTYNFHSEVRDKYGSNVMYDLFQEVFCLLPLCAVIQNRVLVLHGGLFKQTGIKIAHLQRIRRNCQPPVGKASTLEESLMEDILWSDPMPSNGIKPNSSRGAGAYFGPDATAAFLAENGLDMIIRSHECKDEGYEVAHSGKLLTIFSASNYCGDTGNKGAFVIFTPDMKAKVKQFTASDISAIPPPKERVNVMMGNIVRKLIPRICDARIDLLWYWTNTDKDEDGLVSEAEFVAGLKTVLRFDFRWSLILKKLVAFEPGSTNVNFVKFLERYRIDMVGPGSRWIDGVIQKVQEILYEKCQTARQLFDVFDRNGDGYISLFEFMETLKTLNLGLTDNQIYDFMRDIDTDADNKISLEEFNKRFQVRYTKSDVKGDKWVADVLQKIGRILFASHKTVEEAFRKFDQNGDGVLSIAEWNACLKTIGFNLTPDEEQRLLKVVDADGSKHIDIREFERAFAVVDTKEGASWQASIIQSVHNFLYQNRFQLRRVFAMFDINNTGFVDSATFRMGLSSLNILSNSALSETEVDALCTQMDLDGDGKISYSEFLQGFRVRDLVSNPEDFPTPRH